MKEKTYLTGIGAEVANLFYDHGIRFVVTENKNCLWFLEI